MRIRGSLTNDEAHELEAIVDDDKRRERRRQQLLRRDRDEGVTRCAHGTPDKDRCFLCEPFRSDLFPARERVPTGNAPARGSRQR